MQPNFHQHRSRLRARPTTSHSRTAPRQQWQDSLQSMVSTPNDHISRQFRPRELNPGSLTKRISDKRKKRNEQQNQDNNYLATARWNQEDTRGWIDDGRHKSNNGDASMRSSNSRSAAGHQRVYCNNNNNSGNISTKHPFPQPCQSDVDIRRPPLKVPAMKPNHLKGKYKYDHDSPSRPSPRKLPPHHPLGEYGQQRGHSNANEDGSWELQQTYPPLRPNTRRLGGGGAASSLSDRWQPPVCRPEMSSYGNKEAKEGTSNKTAITLCDNDNSDTDLGDDGSFFKRPRKKRKGPPEGQEDSRASADPEVRGDDVAAGTGRLRRRRHSSNAGDPSTRRTSKASAAENAAVGWNESVDDDEVEEVPPPPSNQAAATSSRVSAPGSSQSRAWSRDDDTREKPPPGSNVAAGARSGPAQKRLVDDLSPAVEEQRGRGHLTRSDPNNPSPTTEEASADKTDLTMRILAAIENDSDAALPHSSDRGTAESAPVAVAVDSTQCAVDDADDPVEVKIPARLLAQEAPAGIAGFIHSASSTARNVASGVMSALVLRKHNSKPSRATATRKSFGGKPIEQPGSSLLQSNDNTARHRAAVGSELESPQRAQRNTRTRSRARTPEVIDLCKEDDDYILTPSSRTDMEVTSIAIGKNVFTASCRIVIDVPRDQYELVVSQTAARGRTRSSSRNMPGTTTNTLRLRGRNVLDLKFHYDDDNKALSESEKSDEVAEDPEQQLSFLGMKLEFEEDDDQKEFRGFLDSRFSASTEQYVAVEFRTNSELTHCLQHLRDNDAWKQMLDNGELSESNYADYSQALLMHYKSEKTSRLSSPHGQKRIDSFLAGRAEDDVLVVYPFGGDTAEIEKSADGLNEAKGREESSIALLDARNGSVNDDSKKFSGRGHYMTIRVGDYERLEPVEYLNDTLIDFWMQWFTRHADRSKVHLFSSHFYTALRKKSPDIAKWTRNKGINIFEKQLIFIPINQTLHWSLCVVVNPGMIANAYKDSHADADLWPGIYFFDSLKAHRMGQVAEDVRRWLNGECKRLFDSASTSALADGMADLLSTMSDYEQACKTYPFTKDKMVVTSPKVPYQDNGWDCGVFVCRYAYAMYEVARRTSITLGDFHSVITGSEEFAFDMDDIARIREEFKTLIQNLSKVYEPWKAEEVRKEKAEKATRKAAKRAAASNRESCAMTEANAPGNVVEAPTGTMSPMEEAPNEEPHNKSGQTDNSASEEAGTTPALDSSDDIALTSMDTERDSKRTSPDVRKSESGDESQNPVSLGTEFSLVEVATKNSESPNCYIFPASPLEETTDSPSLSGMVQPIGSQRESGRIHGSIDGARFDAGIAHSPWGYPEALKIAAFSASIKPPPLERDTTALRSVVQTGPLGALDDDSPSDLEREQQETPEQDDDDGTLGEDDTKPLSRCMRSNNNDDDDDGARDGFDGLFPIPPGRRTMSRGEVKDIGRGLVNLRTKDDSATKGDSSSVDAAPWKLENHANV